MYQCQSATCICVFQTPMRALHPGPPCCDANHYAVKRLCAVYCRDAVLVNGYATGCICPVHDVDNGSSCSYNLDVSLRWDLCVSVRSFVCFLFIQRAAPLSSYRFLAMIGAFPCLSSRLVSYSSGRIECLRGCCISCCDFHTAFYAAIARVVMTKLESDLWATLALDHVIRASSSRHHSQSYCLFFD